MGAITDLIKELLIELCKVNLTKMFSYVNDSVGKISTQVTKSTPNWNSNMFALIKTLSHDVMLPIAGMILTFVVCYDLIQMVIDKNNMHEFDTSLFFRFIFKAGIGVYLLSYSMDFVLAIFDVGTHLVTKAADVITDTTAVDISSAVQSMCDNQLKTMNIGELLALAMSTSIVFITMTILSVLINVVLLVRMIEIYIYISVAPIPFSTFMNKEIGHIGSNYFRSLAALALQGFLIMVIVGIYGTFVKNITVSQDVLKTVYSIASATAVLCFSLLKTESMAKSILCSH